AVRGIVEGFYGKPWSHSARRDAISFLAPRGLNAYVYAPKDDAKHRADWRIPYDNEERGHFRELAAHANAHDARFGFAISPGLDVTYEAPADRAAIFAKLEPLLGAGVPWFLLLLDDIPMQAGLATRQGELATWLFEKLRAARADVSLTLCPTEYVGTRPSPYLAELGAGLPPDVDVMWTGPTVCSPTVNVADARGWTAALAGHRTILWDNTPVNDATMTHELHLGPYRGRDAGLVDLVGGVLCNPMTQPRASLVQLATAMGFLSDPDGYDATAAWSRAIEDVAGERAKPLAVLARACADGPLAGTSALDLLERVDRLEQVLDGPGWAVAASEVAAELRTARALPDELAGSAGDDLGAETAPWAQSARAAAAAGLAALRLLQQVRPATDVDSQGLETTVPPDAEAAMHHAFALIYMWTAARADEHVVYGPRFAIYTAVVQLPDGRPALDVGGSLREDASVIDRLCRLALADYEAWRRAPHAATRMAANSQVPFRDARRADAGATR
ncbi:MAG: hyaluronoglucosaminidase, partial [Actinomycetota bacterium]|nr:hyaluronoglucosaminidase [Actinomycetota bacterium]